MFQVELLGETNHTHEIERVSLLFGTTSRAAARSADEPVSQMTPERNVLLWLLEVTLFISAPISWWRQADQYNVQIFPMRRNPDSDDRFLSNDDFEGLVSREEIAILNNYLRDGQTDTAIALLPANFIQRGLAKANYRTLKDIRASMAGTPDEHWQMFLTFLETLPYYELIAPGKRAPQK